MRWALHSAGFVVGLCLVPAAMASGRHTFAPGDKEFLLDGKPFQIIAGEVHYARIPHEYWRHRILMAKAMGLNTIATYIFWNYHEPLPGEFDFSQGNHDLAAFVRIAQEEGMWVILRPGPYACAEWEFGGFPSWLLREPEGKVRERDARFMEACRRYLMRLGQEVASLQVTRGGPVLMVQVENEYGSYGDDKNYLMALRDIIREAGFDVPLFTADGPRQCRNGYIEGVLPAINGDYRPQSVQDTVRTYHHGKGPFFVPEFYPGWLDHWGEEKSVVPVDQFAGQFDTLLASGASVSLYMFHGGTNFGFMNGANYGGRFQPQPTSYDYDAPLDEAGRATPKYYRLREIIAKNTGSGAQLPDPPDPYPSITIPDIALGRVGGLFDDLPAPVLSDALVTMEEIGQSYGYILYRTVVSGPSRGDLVIDGLRDYAVIALDGKKVGSLDRRHRQTTVRLEGVSAGSVLDILVENGGRINYGEKLNDNRKGITGSVSYGGYMLKDWQVFSLPFEKPPGGEQALSASGDAAGVYRGKFVLSKTGDVFLDMSAWSKGCVWVNGRNLGRYWYIGPQQTLFLPGVWLRQGENDIVVLEIEGADRPVVRGVHEPVLNLLRPDRTARPPAARNGHAVTFSERDLLTSGEFVPGDSIQWRRFRAESVRYIALQSLSSIGHDPFASAAELSVLGEGDSMLSKGGWSVFWVDSEELQAEDGHAENAIDGDVETIWHTQWGAAKPQHPHTIVLDLGKEQVVSGFGYQARKGTAPARIHQYRVYGRRTPEVPLR